MLRLKHILLFVLLLLVKSTGVFAAEETFFNELRSSAVSAGNVLTVTDEKFRNFSSGDWAKLTHISVNNYISFELNVDTSLYFYGKPFSATLNVTIHTYNTKSDTTLESGTPQTINLTIRFDTTQGGKYKGTALYKFRNAHKFRVEINSITSPEFGASIPAIFRLTGKTVIDRQYEFQDYSPDISLFQIVNPGQLQVLWTPANYPGAEEFDLEWTVIDSLSRTADSIRNSLVTVDSAFLARIFRNNASRITTSGSSHLFNLAYNSGYLIYRIRGVQVHQPDGIRYEGTWNYKGTQTVGGTTQATYKAITWHQSNLNWQYAASFAEDGKRKEVIRYFDGSLRDRQAVTLDNTNQVPVVQETIYDPEGRAAASILPAPVSTANNILRYYPSFNRNSSNATYSFADFQYGANCGIGAGALSVNSGASGYYSSSNPFLNQDSWNSFIPDAQGYPIAVTAYTPDNTGRIAAQGGVGPTFQLGSGHETRYFYGKPTQTELDRLFGSEAGNASHYLKNMVVDPNGQISVSYINAGGKTVATALAGKAPDSLGALTSATGASTTVRNDLIKTEDFVSDVTSYSLSASATFTAAVTGNYGFRYNLYPEQLKILHGANNQFTLCATCYYDLKIEVKDNCGVVKNSETKPAGLVFDPACSIPQVITDTFTTKIDSIGEYHVSYELVISKNALAYYDSLNLADNTNIRKLSSFLSEELRKMDISNCFNNCATCLEDLGTQKEFIDRFKRLYRQDALTFINDDSLYLDQLYKDELAKCQQKRVAGNCMVSPCDQKLNVIKMDVTPGGQYALYNDTTYQLLNPSVINVLSKFSTVQSFPDEFGRPDTVVFYNILGEDSARVAVNQLSLQDFIIHWKASWADSLARFHPEYCYYLWCTQRPAISNSYAFDDYVKEAVNIGDSAIANGYFSKTDYLALLKKDPFFDPALRGNDSTYFKLMRDNLEFFSRTMVGYSLPDKNILQFTYMVMYCKNEASPWDANCRIDDSCRSMTREWEFYKQQYFNLKEVFYEKARLADPDFKDCRNCYIGNDLAGLGGARGNDTLSGPGSHLPECLTRDDFEYFVEDAGDGMFGIVIHHKEDTPLDMTIQVVISYGPDVNDLAYLSVIFNNSATGNVPGLFPGPIHEVQIDEIPCDLTPIPGDTTTYIGNIDTTYFVPPTNCISNCADNVIYNAYDRPGVSYYVKRAYGQRYQPPVSVPSGYSHGQFYSMFVVTTGPETSCVFYNAWVYIKDDNGYRPVTGNPSSYCPEDSLATLYKDKVRRFPGYVNTESFIAEALSNNPQQQTAVQKAKIIAQCGVTCETKAETWVTFLNNCANTGNAVTDSLLLDQLKKEFIKICKAGCVEGAYHGSSTAPDTASITYHSLEQAIKGIMGSGSISTNCAVEMLADAYPYNRQPVMDLNSIIETDYDICNVVSRFRAAYTSSGFTGSFYQYLRKEIGKGFVISEEELHDIERSCVSCFNIMHNESLLPVAFMPGRRNFINCITADSLKLAFAAKFPAAMPGTDDYMTLRTNFFNQTLGFSLSYFDYQDYFDSVCAKGGTSKLYNEAATPQYVQDRYACMSQLFETAAFNARLRYNDYIDSVRRDFREAYLNKCMSAQADLKMSAELYEYHYTLYYYDQAANLVKTIPPAGVRLLTTAQVDSVQLDRLYGRVDCYKYTDDINFSGTGAKSFDNKAIYNFDTASASIETYLWLQNYNDQALISYYDTTARRGYRLTFENNKLVFRLQQSDTAYFEAKTGNVTGFIPLNSWQHLVATLDRDTTSGVITMILNGNVMPVTIDSQYFAWNTDADPADSNHVSLYVGADNRDSLGMLTGHLKQLRFYKRALTVQEARQNATNPCLVPAKQDALVFWAPVNEGTGEIIDRFNNDTSRSVKDTLTWTRNRTGIFPAHTLPTYYQYNSLNQVTWQETPDASISRFWYDRLGRLVISQNHEQLDPLNGGASNRYSFTRYDSLGRIVKVGEKIGAPNINTINTLDTAQLNTWLASGHDYQVTETMYDVVNTSVVTHSSITNNQQNLRKRVVSTLFREDAAADYDNATHYTYDINGNVKTLWQEIGKLRPYSDNGIKQINYDYDLVSGKVNKVIYQPGKGDQFIYRYGYDAENRLTAAYSSRDGLIWSTDAEYRYYLHGPLARMELGTHKVQGLDYAYTLQGWLKGVNTTNLEGATNITGDMGGDAQNGSRISKDVFGFALHYNHNDFKPIGINGQIPFAALPGAGGAGKGSLFNGNISAMSVSLAGTTQPLLYRYGYDQLNRLTDKRVFSGLDTSNRWTPVSMNDYTEILTYDANGNILTNKRNGTTAAGRPLAMDDLTYHYQSNSNKLTHVSDAVAAGNYTEDIDDQSSGNYTYDRLGNLISDNAEGLQNIQWTVYGKIRSIAKASTAIKYNYDAGGNRVYKQVKTGSDSTQTVYVRDATGNTMAVYKVRNDSTFWDEQYLYGSSRLGVFNYSWLIPAQPIVTSSLTTTLADSLITGRISYELSNHLGNVLGTISDKKLGVVSLTDTTQVGYYKAELLNTTDYYAFGMQMPGRKWDLGGYRFGFNGKENDNDVKGEGNQQDYGMRIYDPRLGRFLSVDPLTGTFPFYTPYQYAGNCPVRFIDLDGEETYDNMAKYWSGQPLINMTPAPARGTNAAGVPRNANWFFKQQLAANPEMFSEANKIKIKINRNPVVDAQWIKHNPAATKYLGERLIHHHIEGGELAAAIPEKLHRDAFSELHPYVTKGASPRGAKIRGIAGGALNMLGNVGMFSGLFTGDPDSWINSFGFGEPQKGDIKKDWGSGLYVQITSIITHYVPVFDANGQPVIDDATGQPKYRIGSKTVNADIYRGYIWNDETKKFEGVDKVDSRTEEWKYNNKGKRVEEKPIGPLS
ncbi:RHS repeat-associated core domain-containing protein [Sediminibacterium ginsengisoli]|uniref:RHS repeat-associated core domain-containing protein n=1 Tax=Sediminibacterium ginsengisoli TaxID=413434 RepID=A0A1T4PPQ7_9BACT|nr:RHS repeat-associated core domain-containing protein [Sediminibacterium ginsengisoli]SJZ93246.1 RHS repeat-associated core domain-containing protein [Sediminibacterium ginsengisoli]